jgi:hypothetical protein
MFLLSIHIEPYIQHAENGAQHQHSDDQRHHSFSPPLIVHVVKHPTAVPDTGTPDPSISDR